MTGWMPVFLFFSFLFFSFFSVSVPHEGKCRRNCSPAGGWPSIDDKFLFWFCLKFFVFPFSFSDPPLWPCPLVKMKKLKKDEDEDEDEEEEEEEENKMEGGIVSWPVRIREKGDAIIWKNRLRTS